MTSATARANAARPAGMLDIRIIMPGLPIAAPDPLAVSLGGSETAGLQLAAEMVRQGHRVAIICNCVAPSPWRGVRLVPWGELQAECEEPCDLFLVQRAPQLLPLRGQAKAAFLWVHDMLTPAAAPDLMRHQHLAD